MEQTMGKPKFLGKSLDEVVEELKRGGVSEKLAREGAQLHVYDGTKERWDATPSLRVEFDGDFQRFAAFSRALSAGKIGKLAAD